MSNPTTIVIPRLLTSKASIEPATPDMPSIRSRSTVSVGGGDTTLDSQTSQDDIRNRVSRRRPSLRQRSDAATAARMTLSSLMTPGERAPVPIVMYKKWDEPADRDRRSARLDGGLPRPFQQVEQLVRPFA